VVQKLGSTSCVALGLRATDAKKHIAELDGALKSTVTQVRDQRIGTQHIEPVSTAPERAESQVERARGFFSTDIGAGWMFWPSTSGITAGSGPVVLTQLSLSFGQMDFERGIGAVTAPHGGGCLERVGWWLGQHLSMSLGLTLHTENVASSGTVKGVFGDSTFGVLGLGLRVSDFLKVNGGVLFGSYDPAGPTRDSRPFIPGFLAVTLDLPVYRAVGNIFGPNPDAYLNKQPLEGQK
jgi:hypothetical protein